MKITIKRFNVHMEIKNKGIEFEVRSPDGREHWGNLILTKSALIWCPGQVPPKHGHKVDWKSFIKLVEKHYPRGRDD